MHINKAFVYGNLTRDPELRALPSGSQVASFALATNRDYKDRDGNKTEETEFHNIVAFGKQAEVIGQYLRKGSPVWIEGRIQTRSWEGEKGKQYRTEIVVENFQFGPKPAAQRAEVVADADAQDARDEVDYPAEDINADDIPF